MSKQPPVKLSVSLKAFREAFGHAAKAAPTRTTKEVLKYVHMNVDAAKKRLTLSATDSEISLRIEMDDIETDGSVDALLPTGRLSALLGELNIETIGIEISPDPLMIYVQAGMNEWKFSTEPATDFPPISDLKNDPAFKLAAGDLVRCLNRTVFATDIESIRYALGGVQFELEQEKATFAATDSRRLAVESCNVMAASGDRNMTGVVPAKAVRLMNAIAATGDVTIVMGTNAVSVSSGNTTITSQLVQGRFPDYRKVIPTAFNHDVNIVVGPFYSAVRQAQIVTNEESKGVDFTFRDGTLRLSSIAADVGQSKIELPVSYTGPDLTITFDPRYVADMLKALNPSDQIDFRLIDHESAALISNGAGYRYVIMPLIRDK